MLQMKMMQLQVYVTAVPLQREPAMLSPQLLAVVAILAAGAAAEEAAEPAGQAEMRTGGPRGLRNETNRQKLGAPSSA